MFSLAAITTLYLIEAKYSQQLPPNVAGSPRAVTTKRPTKMSKMATWHTSLPAHLSTNSYRDEDVTKITFENGIKRNSYIIGRPAVCLAVEQDLETSNLCPVTGFILFQVYFMIKDIFSI